MKSHWEYKENLLRYQNFISQVDSHSQWEFISQQVARRGRLLVTFGSNVIESNSDRFESLKKYLRDFIMDGGVAIIGVFAVPYLMVPENIDIVQIYHDLLEDKDIILNGLSSNIKYFHLADYANSARGTRCWFMEGERFNQDEAIKKEVARFGGPGISFGVSSYALIPGKQFQVEKNGNVNYEELQKQVEKEVQREGVYNILSKNEREINRAFRLSQQ